MLVKGSRAETQRRRAKKVKNSETPTTPKSGFSLVGQAWGDRWELAESLAVA